MSKTPPYEAAFLNGLSGFSRAEMNNPNTMFGNLLKRLTLVSYGYLNHGQPLENMTVSNYDQLDQTNIIGSLTKADEIIKSLLPAVNGDLNPADSRREIFELLVKHSTAAEKLTHLSEAQQLTLVDELIYGQNTPDGESGDHRAQITAAEVLSNLDVYGLALVSLGRMLKQFAQDEAKLAHENEAERLWNQLSAKAESTLPPESKNLFLDRYQFTYKIAKALFTAVMMRRTAHPATDISRA